MRIQHNILAMNSYRNYSNNTSALGKNLEKLSSGYKINRAGDDAAGLAISEKMRAQIQGLNAAQKNVKDAISFVKTAEGAMQEIQDMLSRMKYLATQSANGTYDSEVDRKALQDEVDSLLEEIDRIAESANFNGIYMLRGGDDEEPIDPGSGTALLANTPVATALQEKKDSATTVTLTVSGTEAITALGSVGTVASLASALAGKSLTVAYGDQKYTVTFASTASLVGDDIHIQVTASMTANEILAEVAKAVQNQADAYTGEAKVGQTAFEALSGIDLKIEGGQIVASATSTQWVEGTSNDDAEVKEGTKVSVDLSKVEGNFAENEKVKIGGKYFQFVKTVEGGSTGSTGSMGSGSTANASLNPANLSPAAVPDGSESNPYQVVLGNTFDDSMDALADAINQAGLGYTASFNKTTGELTLETTQDMTEEEFKAATAIEFDTSSEVGAAIKEAWNAAVQKALGGGGEGGPKYSITMQIGDSSASYDSMTIEIDSMKTTNLGVKGSDGSITTSIRDISIASLDSAHDAIDVIKAAINQVSSVRGQLGAYQNRLEHTQNNLSVMTENIQDAESTIRDTDVADEMMAYVKNNILVQSAQAMLAQANQVPQGVLQLLG